MKILSRLWLLADKVLHLVLFKQIVTTIYGLVSNANSWHITKRGYSTPDEDIWRIDQIGINIASDKLLLIIKDTIRLVSVETKTYDNTVYMCFKRRLTVPSESAMGKIDVNSLVE